MTPEPLPTRLSQLVDRVPALRNRLAALETDLTIERAQLYQFTGETAARWEELTAAIATAWDAYLLADEHRSEVQHLVPAADPTTEGKAKQLLDAAEEALDRAEPAVAGAEATVADLTHRWHHQEPRVMEAHAAALAVGAADVASYAEALVELLGRDPLALGEGDIETLESRTESARAERAESERRASQLGVEVSKAGLLEDLGQVMEDTHDCLTYARSRIAGLATEDPVTADEVAALNQRFRQISERAGQAPSHEQAAELATELESWRSDYATLRQRWDAALDESCTAVQRRDQHRGTWKALRAKASACGLDEDPELAKLMSAVRQLLWAAPLDLDLADRTLAQLAGHINDRVRRMEERR